MAHTCKISIPIDEGDAVLYPLSTGGVEEWGRVATVWSTEENKKKQTRDNVEMEVVSLLKNHDAPYPVPSSKKVEGYYETDKRRVVQLKDVTAHRRCVRLCPTDPLAHVPRLKCEHLLDQYGHLKKADFNKGIFLISQALTSDTRPDGFHESEAFMVQYQGEPMLRFPICSTDDDDGWTDFDPSNPESPFYLTVKHHLFDICIDPACKTGRRTGKEKGRTVWEFFIRTAVECSAPGISDEDRAHALASLGVSAQCDRGTWFRETVSLSVLVEHVIRVIQMKKLGMASFRVMNYLLDVHEHAYNTFNPPKEVKEIKNFVIPDGLDVDSEGELIDPKTGQRVIVIEDEEEDEEDDDKSSVSLDSEESGVAPKRRRLVKESDSEVDETYSPSSQSSDEGKVLPIVVRNDPEYMEYAPGISSADPFPDIPSIPSAPGTPPPAPVLRPANTAKPGAAHVPARARSQSVLVVSTSEPVPTTATDNGENWDTFMRYLDAQGNSKEPFSLD